MSDVYFIRSGNGPIKIGVARNPVQRLSDLQCGNPETLRLVAVMPGGHHMEKLLHRRFRRLNVIREWFTADDDLLSFIDGLLGVPLDARPAFATDNIDAAKRAQKERVEAMHLRAAAGISDGVGKVIGLHGMDVCARVAGACEQTLRNARKGRNMLSGPALAALVRLDPESFEHVLPRSRHIKLLHATEDLLAALATADLTPGEVAELLPILRAAQAAIDQEIARLKPKAVANG